VTDFLAMRGRYHRPQQRRTLTLTVRDRVRISPHFVSVTLGGEDVQHLEQSGHGQWGRLFFPGPGQGRIAIPGSANWRLQLVSSARRPRIRSYTIRRFRPELSAFDLEIALHETSADGRAGPGSTWAATAETGSQVGFLDEGHSYSPGAEARWQLLVGDESALPAVLDILERTAEILPAEVFLEVPSSDDIRAGVAPAGTTIHWLPRNDPSAKPGALALETVTQARLPDGPFYTWTAGESALPTGLRRHLVTDRRVAKSDITFSGYWRHGRASLG
jgi:NADPH-dependent ferric siderophore reductase